MLTCDAGELEFPYAAQVRELDVHEILVQGSFGRVWFRQTHDFALTDEMQQLIFIFELQIFPQFLIRPSSL